MQRTISKTSSQFHYGLKDEVARSGCDWKKRNTYHRGKHQAVTTQKD
jgi:hypothetical protein